MDRQAWLDGSTAESAPTERDYHELWVRHAAPLSNPVELAISGGRLADRLAWVFAAGYQATMADVFPAVPRWTAFCVSEGKDDRPPVESRLEGPVQVASGFKTWVAGSDSLSHVIVKVNRGAAAFYVALARDRAGVSVTTPKSSSFLGELSQGIVELTDVRLSDSDRVDTSRLSLFGILEPLYVYLAFLAFAARSGMEATLETAEELIGCLDTLDAAAPAFARIAAIDERFQNVVDGFERVAARLPPDWARDKRLLSMYSPAIQKRAAPDS